MRLWSILIAAVIAAFVGISPASASCTISVANGNFATYSGTLLTPGTIPITLRCGTSEHYYIGLTAGAGQGATVTTRKLTGPGGATLSYQLFRNATRTSVWGNSPGTDTLEGSATGSTQTLQIYPRVAAGQSVRPGTYVDTVTAHAGAATTTFTITATVAATCTVGSESLSFGIYAGVQKDGVAVLTVTCSSTTTYNVGLGIGNGSGATITTRRMTGPSATTLNYQMFQNSGRTTNWGNTVGSSTEPGTGTGGAQGLYIYGRIPGGQFVRPGSYADTIIATVTY